MTPSATDAPRAGQAAVPAVSVVVIGYSPVEFLLRCLSALEAQRAEFGGEAEVLAVGHWEVRDEVGPSVRSGFSGITWVPAPTAYNVARMRGLGIARSRGRTVALLEDDCVPDPGWLRHLVAVPPEGAVGGAVEPGELRRGVDWAAYFCEYASFMSPLPVAPRQLPGTNVAYRRAALPPAGQLETDGFYETFIHEGLRQAGFPVVADSVLVVRHQRSWPAGALLATRYHHGRGYAGMRVRSHSLWTRVPFMALAFALPAVLAGRVAAEIIRRRRHVGPAIRALPWIVALSVSWSVGELVGYAAGPGDSLARWR